MQMQDFVAGTASEEDIQRFFDNLCKAALDAKANGQRLVLGLHPRFKDGADGEKVHTGTMHTIFIPALKS